MQILIKDRNLDMSNGCPRIQDLSSGCPGRQVLVSRTGFVFLRNYTLFCYAANSFVFQNNNLAINEWKVKFLMKKQNTQQPKNNLPR